LQGDCFFAKRQNSQIILLDEATSFVDTINEKIIYTNLMNDFKDKFLVASVHKMHLLHFFDYIYVISDGAIVEEGTLSKLSRLSTHFLGMWKNYQETREADNLLHCHHCT